MDLQHQRRQTVFFYEGNGSPGQPEWRYKARMVDQGFCFNVGEWNFPDPPLRGLYSRNACIAAWKNR